MCIRDSLIAIAFANGLRKWTKDKFKAGNGSRDIREMLSGGERRENKKEVLWFSHSL